MEEKKKEDKNLCPVCKCNPATEPHLCPFASDVHEDDTPCTCCVECEEACAMDI